MIIPNYFIALLIATVLFMGCKKDSDEDTTPAPVEPKLIFKYKFDSTQTRLNSTGAVSAVPSNHGAQSPVFNSMSSHYIELSQTATTALGSGAVLYHAAETNVGGSLAIDFSKASLKGNNEIFYSIPLKDVAVGTYNYLRVSLAYQNYDIKFRYTTSGINYDSSGTIASFIGYNTYINSIKVKNQTLTVNGNRLQGFWAFEIPGVSIDSGQASPGATTVPNPINGTSPVPSGSCVVTGAFASALTITGNETEDIVITVSLSTNKSFEWEELSTPGYFEPAAGDRVVDMGIRGLTPIVN
ncbi:MAG TPA: hypothetical protein PKN75_09150 [Bacteroidia bacterium]|nr:hypothetical protein [Bacteroidia bacterium]HNU33747.1 hypothetical protein [Bacteroidia bacterium]